MAAGLRGLWDPTLVCLHPRGPRALGPGQPAVCLRPSPLPQAELPRPMLASASALSSPRPIFSSFWQLILDRGEVPQLGTSSQPPSAFDHFFNPLVFCMREPEGSCSPTGLICHSINQKSSLMTHRCICNGMVIYVHNNSLEVASVPTGTDQGKIKPCSVYSRLSKSVADCFQWSREGSVSIRDENGEGGGGRRRQGGPRRE